MDDYKYIKEIEDDIEEFKRLIEHCSLSDMVYKVSVTSDFLRGLKENGTVDNMTYNNFKNKIQQLSEIAWRKCKCENK